MTIRTLRSAGVGPSSVSERLEPRRLLAGTVSLVGGLLTITGSDGNNAISIERKGPHLKLKLDNKPHHFDPNGVSGIVIDGRGGNDRIVLDDGIVVGSTLRGGAGHDTVTGGDGNDQLDGGEGNDVLDGRRGADVCVGGEGSDTADYSHRTAPLSLHPGQLCGEALENDELGSDIETIIGGEGDDGFSIESDTLQSLVIDGRGGDDHFFVNIPGKLTVLCGTGDDFLELPTAGELIAFGGPGNDHLDDIYSDDTLRPTLLDGGPGDDLFHPVWFDQTTVIGGDGFDHFELNQFGEWAVVLDLRTDPFTQIEKITGTDGDDLIIAGNDPLFIDGLASETGDTLIGGPGNDTLVGTWGDDLLIGNGGNDLLRGEGGDDVFINGGDNGADTVDGMDGDDTADFDPLDALFDVESIV